MNIIFLSGLGNNKREYRLSVPYLVAAMVVAVVVGGALFWGGYQFGLDRAVDTTWTASTDRTLREVADERLDIEQMRQQTQAHLDALATHMAELQAQVMRVNAVGDRLVSVAKLDPGEFDFSSEPAVGGVDALGEGRSQDASDIIDGIAQMTALLDAREHRLTMMEDLLTNRELLNTSLPAGRPVRKGWMSSNYGYRTDPFHGKKNFHRGVDFAGKPGAPIFAVADGVVIRSEHTSGYGNVIEIRHADGYSTVYAHNKANRVAVGDVVSRGDHIAWLGSTGRSRGPHVHFEVRKEGRVVDPKRFVAAR